MNRLIRISFGPFQLLDMAPGGVEPVQRRVLVDQLSAGIARELGLMDPEREAGGPPGAASRPITRAPAPEKRIEAVNAMYLDAGGSSANGLGTADVPRSVRGK